MDIKPLNDELSIADQLFFVEGNGDYPCIRIRNAYADALISVYGGQVLSFRPKGSDELLFLGEKAFFEEGKAIKGGVPVCWPWFGPHPEKKSYPAHGFVRNRMWNVMHTETTENGSTKVSLGIKSTAETRSIWPHDFSLKLDITVSDTMLLELTTRNTGDQTFSMTQALHSYFSVGDVSQIQLLGLEDKQYIDKTDSDSVKQQDGIVTISNEVDRIYYDAPALLTIADKSMQRNIQINSSGNRTTVVWNPWSEISKSSADLQDDDYQRFLCVETVNAVADAVEVAAGDAYKLTAEITIEIQHSNHQTI
ncbi:MAG: D-hexose-6-phosphate mutarotase [Gammaproteobacteria bacterium]|nr:D-hexose-6-phosphate mutarotase [Gammaproteobacteria bacterium]